jgi:phosphatidylserine decarboxylase
MRFAREGLPFISGAAVLAGLTWWYGLARGQPTWLVILACLLTLTTAFVAWFFRDPDREIPQGEGLVVSPADGKILEILEVEEPDVFDGPARRITIFLSVFNVHVQRSPTGGDVVHRDYHAGGYAVAWHPKASDENERASVGIQTPEGRIKVTQIAGLIARRIVTYPKEGDQLARGQHIGLIRFGSRVDLFIPSSWEVRCAPGDVVRGGETVMAARRTDPGVPEQEEQEGE